ncbi:MAG: HPr family phosphocarrier protein [Candidatus Alectryocaccobium sp.]|nr:HPr family phosphocarrier protein [Candidatus Alectryocaccobium sp.]
MKERAIILNKFEDIVCLARVAGKCDFGIDIGKSKNIAHDAKSIIGIMAFGLNNPLKIFYNGSNKYLDEFIESHSIQQ